MNSIDEIKLRKYESILRISGTGVVVFGLWSFVKTIIYVLFQFSYFETVLGIDFNDVDKTAFVVMLVIIMIMDILFRLYIRKQAKKEAEGYNKGYLYIVFAVIMVFLSINSVISYIYDSQDILEKMAAIITDITSIIITVELIVSALYVRRHRKA